MPRGSGRHQGEFAVLVVEDNPMVRANAVHLFQDLGFPVFDAYNGVEALRLVKAHPEIGLLFIDVRMPGMSGPELADAAQRVRPRLRIVFTSGYVDERAVPGEVPFVPKPWRVDQVSEAIAAAVRTARDEKAGAR
jgi:CheY-like chemotaxis protein